ncbi:hypothetical protein L3V86_00540 [Thiotrichales bacterium 19S11-10]|nr:hypothetical protein [Thiotrichales bacterium 19S11-10]
MSTYRDIVNRLNSEDETFNPDQLLLLMYFLLEKSNNSEYNRNIKTTIDIFESLSNEDLSINNLFDKGLSDEQAVTLETNLLTLLPYLKENARELMKFDDFHRKASFVQEKINKSNSEMTPSEFKTLISANKTINIKANTALELKLSEIQDISTVLYSDTLSSSSSPHKKASSPELHTMNHDQIKSGKSYIIDYE